MAKWWLIAAAMLLVQPVRAQTTLYVDDDAVADPGPGDVSASDPLEDGSLLHPFDAIQEALDLAAPGDTVLVRDGTYQGVGNYALSFNGKDLILTSENGPETCILDAGRRGHGIRFENGETAASEVIGLTITRARVRDECGGGIYCDNASPTFRDCIILDNENWADSEFCKGGAGAFFLNSSSLVVDCVFRRNENQVDDEFGLSPSSFGGGIHARSSGLVIRNSLFELNYGGGGGEGGGGGGGAYLSSSTVLLEDSTFRVNFAGGGGSWMPGNFVQEVGEGSPGGAIAATNCDLTIRNCRFIENFGGGGGSGTEDDGLNGRDGAPGGAIYLSNTTARIHGSEFRENRAGGGGDSESNGGDGADGGAIYATAGSQVTLTNVVLAGNLAGTEGEADRSGLPGAGGALAAHGTSTFDVVNATVVGNRSPSDLPAADVFYGDVSVANSIVRGPFDQLAGGGQLTIRYSNVEGGYAGEGNIDSPPGFRDPDGADDDENTYDDNDYHPRLGASGNDAGDNTALPVDALLDFDGGARLTDDPNRVDTGVGVAPIVDLGAFEVNNGVPTDCDNAYDPSLDCDNDGILDACQSDCDGNGQSDLCDVLDGTLPDCNGNGVPDECDVSAGVESDCNGNGIPDSCDIASGTANDCDGNGVPDTCDLSTGPDCNANGIPDVCEPDCDQDGIPDSCEFPGPFDGGAVRFHGAARLSFGGGVSDYRVDEVITVEAWVYPTALGGSRTIVRKSGNNYWLRLVDGHVRFGYTGSVAYKYDSLDAIPLNAWTHIAVVHTFATSEITLYLNGAPVPGSWLVAPADDPVNVFGPLYVGNNFAETSGFYGLIDELRVWDRARTPGEIAADYDQLVSTSSPGLKACLRFDDLPGDEARELILGHTDELPPGVEWQSLFDCPPCSIVTPENDCNGDGVVDECQLDDRATLLVCSRSTDSVLVYDAETGAFLRSLTVSAADGLGYPNGLAVAVNGDVFVSSVTSNSVFKLAMPGGEVVAEFSDPALAAPVGLAFSASGSLLVASYGSDSVLAFDPDTGVLLGTYLSTTPQDPVQLDGPTDIVTRENGNLLVASQKNDLVLEFSPAGDLLGAAASGGGLDYPSGLALDASGTLLVGSFRGDQILAYDPNGAFLGALVEDEPNTPLDETGGLSNPEGLRFGPSGSLLVSNRGGTGVLEYDATTGDFLGVFTADTGPGEPTYLALATLARDCNGNGIPDDCDPDTNGDGVADDCQTLGCPGDVDGNDQVDLADLAAVLASFGATGSGLSGDVDGDGDVDLQDLGIVLAAFGQACT